MFENDDDYQRHQFDYQDYSPDSCCMCEEELEDDNWSWYSCDDDMRICDCCKEDQDDH